MSSICEFCSGKIDCDCNGKLFCLECNEIQTLNIFTINNTKPLKKFSYNSFLNGLKQACVSCKNDYFIFDRTNYEITCEKCGIIQEGRLMIDGADWNNYESNRQEGNDNSRVGWVDESNPYNTLGSVIKKSKLSIMEVTDENGNKIKRDLAKTQQFLYSSNKEKSFYEIIKTFNNLVYIGAFSQRVVDRAKIYWNEIVKKNRIFRGGNRKGILACCVYYSCLYIGYPCNREFLASKMNISKDDIVKGEPIFKDIISNSKFKDILEKDNNITNMFSPIIDQLGLPYKFYVGKCCEIFKLCENELSEISSSASIAGVLSYVIHDIKQLKSPTKKEITTILGITNPTLKNSLKIITERINETSSSI